MLPHIVDELPKVLTFLKCHASGNDYIIPFHPNHEKHVELTNQLLNLDKCSSLTPSKNMREVFIQMVCERRFSIGSDGLLLLDPEQVRMKMFNPDGSEAEMCGNGLRCTALFFAKYFKDQTCIKSSMSSQLMDEFLQVHVKTQAGIKSCIVNLRTSEIECGMGIPRMVTDSIPIKNIYHSSKDNYIEDTLQTEAPQADMNSLSQDDNNVQVEFTVQNDKITPRHIFKLGVLPLHSIVGDKEATFPSSTPHSLFCVSMGNPHAVIFVDNCDEFPIHEWGPLIENHPIFANRTNVEFVTVKDYQNAIVRQRTWERGAGETYSCGTGGAAVASVCVILGKVQGEIVQIHMNGGIVYYHCLLPDNESSQYITISSLQDSTSSTGSGIQEVKLRGQAIFTFKGEIELNWENM